MKNTEGNNLLELQRRHQPTLYVLSKALDELIPDNHTIKTFYEAVSSADIQGGNYRPSVVFDYQVMEAVRVFCEEFDPFFLTDSRLDAVASERWVDRANVIINWMDLGEGKAFEAGEAIIAGITETIPVFKIDEKSTYADIASMYANIIKMFNYDFYRLNARVTEYNKAANQTLFLANSFLYKNVFVEGDYKEINLNDYRSVWYIFGHSPKSALFGEHLSNAIYLKTSEIGKRIESGVNVALISFAMVRDYADVDDINTWGDLMGTYPWLKYFETNDITLREMDEMLRKDFNYKHHRIPKSLLAFLSQG